MNNYVIECPIYFEDHRFGGHVASIENLTSVDLDVVRTTILNGKPYFAAADVCKGLYIDSYRHAVIEAVADINNYNYCKNVTPCTRTTGLENSLNTGFVEDELYYYLNIEVSHANRHGIVNQSVPMIFIAEPVVYMLMFKSRKREAIHFKAWLAMDILPGLRVLGRENAEMLIHTETTKMMETLNEINAKYDQIKDILLQNNSTVGQLFDFEMIRKTQDDTNLANLNNNVISVLNTMNLSDRYDASNIMSNINTLNEKVTDIASGLNMIFCGR